jgi:hypothetical protein
MTAHTTPEKAQDTAFEIHCIRSGLLVTSHALESLNPGHGEDLPEGLRDYELYEGVCFLLDLLAFRMEGLYRRVNKE